MLPYICLMVGRNPKSYVSWYAHRCSVAECYLGDPALAYINIFKYLPHSGAYTCSYPMLMCCISSVTNKLLLSEISRIDIWSDWSGLSFCATVVTVVSHMYKCSHVCIIANLTCVQVQPGYYTLRPRRRDISMSVKTAKRIYLWY